ncbi:MAG TPA: hypothetical protein VJ761_06430, partial [Ktedonobacteraceae bacterium]|nr:hypothetical protein [Ktedonobacteraceae bacterium]
FMILTKGGATREMADEIFSRLQQADKRDSLAAAYTLTSLAFGKENSREQNWLLRRVSDMDDVLRETPVYQQMTRWAREEGLERGLEEGRKEGLEKGRYEGLQQALLAIVTERFPKLVRLTNKVVALIDKPEVLQLLIVKMSIAQSATEAKEYLLEADEDE